MNETGPSVQKQLEDQGMKRTPRTWIDEALDELEGLLESRLSKSPGHPFKNSEFRNWVVMQNEILDSLKKLNEFASFMGHRFVAAETKRILLESKANAEGPTNPHRAAAKSAADERGVKLAGPPQNVTTLKSST